MKIVKRNIESNKPLSNYLGGFVFSFFILLIFINHSYAQIGNVWVYGESASLDFNTEPPSMLENRIVHEPNEYWGAATICDSMGDFQYYFSGLNIYDKNFNIIENGNNIKGYSNHMQTSIFLPADSGLIYLFHGHLMKGLDSFGLYYSIIDKNKNIVIEKNKLIDSGAFFSLIALPHANKKDFWIVSKKYPDTFLILHFTGNGIVENRKQCINKPYTPYYMHKESFVNWTRLSQSNSGNSFLESYHISYQNIDSIDQPNFFKNVSYLNNYDFNNKSGEIIKKSILVKHFTNEFIERKDILNASYSSNDSVIYVLYIYIYNKKYQPIDQYVLQDGAYENKYRILHDFEGSMFLRDLKLAPNGKIYLSYIQTPYVAEISQPNSQGEDCYFKAKSIKISNEDLCYSLTLPNTYFQYINLNLKHRRCGSPYNFISYYDTTVFKYFTWYFEGGDSAVGADVNYHFPKTGRYFVKLKGISENGYCQWYSDSITYIKPPQANFSFDSKQGCQWIGFNFYDSSTTDTIHPTKGQSWLWDFGDGTYDTAQNPTHVFTKTGFYNVKLIYSNGFCEDSIIKTQSIEIIAAPKPGFAVNESQYCTPFDLKITDQSVGDVQDYLYTTSNGLSSIQPNPVFRFNQPGAYKIVQTFTGPTGCITKDSTTIHLTKGFDSLEIINILTATVNPQEFIEVSWEKHPTAINYQVYRNGKELTQIVGNTFNDSGVDVHNSVYSYKVAGIDSCGSFSQNSLPVKNILLTGESQGNEFCIVRWTAFEQWHSGVED
jgi:PKD repeat protein